MTVTRRIARELDDRLEVSAGIAIDRLWQRMLNEALDEFERLDRQNLGGDDLERALIAFMDELSDRPVEDLARGTSTVAYNEGRSAEILSARARGEVQYVVRSEVLDTNTCRPCQMLDSEVFEVGDPEYYANMPPAQCDGGDRCRGFYVPVGRGADA